MVLSEIIRFFKYDHPILYRLPSQFHFTRKDNHPTLGPKNLRHPTPELISFEVATDFLIYNLWWWI